MGSPVGGRNSLGTKRRGGLRRHSAQTLKPLVDGIWETESDRLARLPKGGRRKGRMFEEDGGRNRTPWERVGIGGNTKGIQGDQ